MTANVASQFPSAPPAGRPGDPALAERRRQQAVAGGYRLPLLPAARASYAGRGRKHPRRAVPGRPPDAAGHLLDGHPHTLAFLAAARGDLIRCLGVTDFGQSSSLEDAYRLHQIDAGSITDAALSLLRR